ncbi:MAG: hypothetical protein AAGA66_18565 [Bacteroidota bacterium]
MIFLAGGTGIAPIKAIMEELFASYDSREIFLYWGMTSPERFYLEELLDLPQRHKHFHFIPVASETPSWGGRTGFVHKAVMEDFENLSGFDVYACGSPLMIDSAREAFIEQGLPAEQFYSDSFTPSK